MSKGDGVDLLGHEWGRGDLDDASSVTILELLAASAGTGVVAAGHLVLDDGLATLLLG